MCFTNTFPNLHLCFSSLQHGGSRTEVFNFEEGRCIIHLSSVGYPFDAELKTFSLNSSSQSFSTFLKMVMVYVLHLGL